MMITTELTAPNNAVCVAKVVHAKKKMESALTGAKTVS